METGEEEREVAARVGRKRRRGKKDPRRSATPSIL
jgi:hypothetical protein